MESRTRRARYRASLLILASLVAGLTMILLAAPALSEDCMDCHAVGAGRDAPEIEPGAGAAHQDKTCDECHPGEVPPCPPQLKPVSCKTCHKDQTLAVGKSGHGNNIVDYIKEKRGAATLDLVCMSCHGEDTHLMKKKDDPISPVFPANVSNACSTCHGQKSKSDKFEIEPSVVTTYLNSYHGLYQRLGDTRTANCFSCHGNHAVLEAGDDRSPVHPANLGATCAGCHPELAGAAIRGKVHVARQDSHFAVGIVRYFYIALIAAAVGAMLVHNAADLRYKIGAGEPYSRAESFQVRFSFNEKAQHAALTICFVVLAWTGFALSFPESAVALPFHWLPSGSEVREWLHRAAAGVFILLGLYHLLYLATARRGRAQFKLVIPRMSDLGDLKKVAVKYVRRGPEKIELPHYAYVEKAEYWTLIWGGALMSLTGLALLGADDLLGLVPLWVADLAGAVHFYEAALAVIGLIVWHGYWALRNMGR